jgi:hypothetical protein
MKDALAVVLALAAAIPLTAAAGVYVYWLVRAFEFGYGP